jgi:hypothetical protein
VTQRRCLYTTPAAPIDRNRTNESTRPPRLRIVAPFVVFRSKTSVLGIVSFGTGFVTICYTASAAILYAVPVPAVANVLVEAPSMT